ncbi:MAG TPA: PASTA domain-containing protein [Propionibacteriaceae bacterium]|nr:PASTA domain-containing protein [Propionibacteriaceae bacterium]
MTSETPDTPSAEEPPALGGPLPFAVKGPGDLKLAADRTGTTTFTVTNLTGRPVRVRLQPKSSDPSHDVWYKVAGDPEVPMTVGATITVDVRASVPAGVPAGTDSLHLRAVDEADPEQVTDGQPVAVAIPAAPEPPKKGPFLLIAIIALVVLLVGGGAIWWFLLRKPTRPPEPPALTVIEAPVITGQALVGAVVTTTPGTWSNATSTSVQWFACTTPTACTAIPGASGTAFQVTGAQVGTQLKVTSSAVGATSSATADSQLTPVVRTPVPNVVTYNVYGARNLLQAYGLTSTVLNDPFNSGCSVVTAQSPAPGSVADKGGVVQLTVIPKSPISCVFVNVTYRATYIPVPTKS